MKGKIIQKGCDRRILNLKTLSPCLYNPFIIVLFKARPYIHYHYYRVYVYYEICYV